MHRPLPVLTIRAGASSFERAEEDLVAVLVGLGLVEDRRGTFGTAWKMIDWPSGLK